MLLLDSKYQVLMISCTSSRSNTKHLKPQNGDDTFQVNYAVTLEIYPPPQSPL